MRNQNAVIWTKILEIVNTVSKLAEAEKNPRRKAYWLAKAKYWQAEAEAFAEQHK